ncbi:putative Zn(2)-C6 fungal-type domain-containing protein [Seiridium unicorne]|uniref:Zn(2)-C6 fungal-type domain-containing protein n=1 Tax=Seiridium unicorne TaxID=138068 RepID=A0ABR2VFA8_9PEZI
MSFTPRVSQRKPLSCSECTRRKLRCSKTIPCTSCLDRGLEATCAREKVIVRKKQQRAPSIGETSSHGAATATGSLSLGSDLSGSPLTVESLCDGSSPDTFKSQHPSAAVPDDAPVTLENLALGRQRILNMQSPSATTTGDVGSGWLPAEVDFLVTLDQARILLDYHSRNLAWIHNVLHMPTFVDECEAAFNRYTFKSRAWIALFYAFLCHTAFHGPETLLASVDLLPQKSTVEFLYTRTIEALHTADFMGVHSLHATQAVCLVIQVGHNLGQSDFVFVLLSSTTRIAQSLDINRLGPESGPSQDPIAREVKKRVWWFLIKQDWMQIPYGNMFTINALHFNTPPPLNCLEDPREMCGKYGVRALDSSVLTQSSWAGIHNHIAILIYKTHDKMCRHGHPGSDPSKVRGLYDEVLKANAELQQLWNRRPDFLRMDAPLRPEWPSSVPHLRRLFAISFARSYFTIHRHFQLKSFRDDTYSVTRISCLAAARSSLRTFIEWPDDDESLVFKKMWTNNNNLVAAAVALLFGVLFSSEQADGIFEKMEMRQLLTDFLPCLRRVGVYSSVAKRGADLISVILDYERAIAEGARDKLDIEEVVGHVKTSGLAGIAPSYTDWNTTAIQYDFMNMESWVELPES